MRIANLSQRATLVTDDGLIDVAEASRGQFSWRTDDLVGDLAAVAAWYAETAPAVTEPTTPEQLRGDTRLGPVLTRPPQIFAIGLNYRAHAGEMHLAMPPAPMVFTKFASCLTGPYDEVPVVSATTDFEAELVVVLGRTGRDVDESQALEYVAGYCVGQDFSDRHLQMQGTPAQFPLGKSYRSFGPIGPWLTTADAVAHPQELMITCSVNGKDFQRASTGDMVHSVSEIVSYLSTVVELRAGDLIFTGTPDGTGQGQNPPRFLTPGDTVVTTIEGLGSLTNTLVAG